MPKGPFLAIKHAWPELIRRPGGRIVITASTTALVGEAFKAAYVSSKHGVAGLMKVAALEGARHGLNVNAVAPGSMWTLMAERQIDDQARLHGRTRAQVLADMDVHNPAGAHARAARGGRGGRVPCERPRVRDQRDVHPGRPGLARLSRGGYGAMLWFSRKTFSGSYRRLTSTSRS